MGKTLAGKLLAGENFGGETLAVKLLAEKNIGGQTFGGEKLWREKLLAGQTLAEILEESNHQSLYKQGMCSPLAQIGLLCTPPTTFLLPA